MSTVSSGKKQKSSSLFRPNPVLSRLSKVEDRSASDAVTYTGVAAKVSYFLLVTLAGLVAQLVVMNTLSEPVWQSFSFLKKFTVSISKAEGIILIAVVLVGFICQLFAIFARKTVPVTGTVYSAGQGYLISFLVFKVLRGYEHIGLEALLLTAAVIAVMSWLYSSGTIKDNDKFRTVLLTLVLGSIALALISFIGTLIPVTRPYVQSIFGNPGVAIALDVFGIIIAALFLISDFSMISTCVKEGYPREYEWSCAFGLVFTVIWIYLKILDLLMQLQGNSKD